MIQCSDLTNDVLLDPATPDARNHLEACAGCRARAAELRSLAGDLAELGRALPARENPALVRRILSRTHKKLAPRGRVRQPSPARWIAAAAAAALVVIAIVVATREPEPQAPGVVATPEKPTLETILDPVPPPPPPRRDPEPAPLPKETPPAPRPPEPPPVPPEPKPVEPEKPSPKPVEPPAKPVIPPTQTKPVRIFAAIAQVEGVLDLQGKKVEKGTEWEKDAALRSGDRLARFTLADGTRLTLRPHSELQLRAADELDLERGEVFGEVVPGAGRKFAIVTADARVSVTGTQFSVKRGDHTEIVVTAGEVRVANDKGEVTVPAGSGTTARKASAPARPHAVDADAAMAWRRAIDPPESPRFRYDFEDSRKPMPWENGKVVAGPARGLNRGCLEGSPGISLNLTNVDKRVSTVKGTLKVRFRYYASGGDMLWVMLWDDRVKDNFRFDLKTLAHGKWETFEANLSEFYLMADGAAKIQEGDRFSFFNVAVSGTTGPVYFDDIELVEVLSGK